MRTLETNHSAAASLKEALKGSGRGLSSSNSLDSLVKVAGGQSSPSEGVGSLAGQKRKRNDDGKLQF